MAANKCLQFTMFTFNLLFLVIGLAVIVAGAMLKAGIDNGTLNISLGTVDMAEFNGAAIAFIVVGCFVFLVAFFGCLGAYKLSTGLLTTYAVILAVIVIIQIAVGIAAYVLHDKVTDNIDAELKRHISGYKEDKATIKSIDELQMKLECCGADGSSDWDTEFSSDLRPGSCCGKKNATCSVKAGDKIFDKGCLQKIGDTMKSGVMPFAIALAVLGFIEIAGIVVACLLAKNSKEEYKEV